MNDLELQQQVSEIGFEVYDNDSGERVLVTAEMQADASQSLQQMYSGVIVTAMNIKKFKDNRLYLAVFNEKNKPFTSWKSFVEGELVKIGIGYATAQRYYRVADVFSHFLDRFIEGDNSEFRPGAKRNYLPLRKLEELTRLPKEKLDELTDSEMLTTDDGRSFTLIDLLELKKEDIIKEVKQLRKSNSTLEEGKSLAEEQLSQANERLDSLADHEYTAARVVELEKMLEELQGKVVSLEKANKLLQELDNTLQHAFTVVENIQMIGTIDNKQAIKLRMFLSGVIARASKIMTDKGLTYLDPATVYGDIPGDGDKEESK